VDLPNERTRSTATGRSLWLRSLLLVVQDEALTPLDFVEAFRGALHYDASRSHLWTTVAP
jgi:hypothetical protein